ncbi:hypothetical protein FDP41_004873 [Naegleria fowleri]|uniref:protein-serine/threonine phosphatase n=1 Tax=Naegleria fowleri TaxID=5763 RepID=A0A6A5BPR6_NAEFO|nr:uncharacterized protein FDP41_004873 [Naegleria fowleri]KAF0976198.1 hypothetical protein FDP41_004873 [Naegleria fowleri]CAG4710871.1 unnamed protein product [Naegleria fowleri]
MGQILDKPVTEKTTHVGRNGYVQFACSSMQGFRLSMEDRHNFYTELPRFAPPKIQQAVESGEVHLSFFAVFDGHSGDTCAEFLSKNLFKLVLNEEVENNPNITAWSLLNSDQNIEQGFMRTDAEFDKSCAGVDDSGSTATTLTVKRIGKDKLEVICANTGDSRTIMHYKGKTEPLSYDHKPHVNSEKTRIAKAKSYVEFGRVNGTLAVSRAFGDLTYKKYDKLPPEEQAVIPLPEIKRVILDLNDTSEYNFAMLACDGVWDVMSNADATNFVLQRLLEQKNGTYKRLTYPGDPPQPPSDHSHDAPENHSSTSGFKFDLGSICEDVLDHAVRGLDSKDNVSVIIILFQKDDDYVPPQQSFNLPPNHFAASMQ